MKGNKMELIMADLVCVFWGTYIMIDKYENRHYISAHITTISVFCWIVMLVMNIIKYSTK